MGSLLLSRNKRGISNLLWIIAYVVVITALSVALFTYIARVGSGHQFEQHFLSRDLAYLGNIIQASPGTLVYEFKSSIKDTTLAYFDSHTEVMIPIDLGKNLSSDVLPSKFLHPLSVYLSFNQLRSNPALRSKKLRFKERLQFIRNGKDFITQKPKNFTLDELDCERYRQVDTFERLEDKHIIIAYSYTVNPENVKIDAENLKQRLGSSNVEIINLDDREKLKKLEGDMLIVLNGLMGKIRDGGSQGWILISNPSLENKKLACLLSLNLENIKIFQEENRDLESGILLSANIVYAPGKAAQLSKAIYEYFGPRENAR